MSPEGVLPVVEKFLSLSFPTRPRRHEIIERGGVTVLFGGTVLDTIISDSHYNGCDLFIGRNFLVKKVGFAALC